MICIQHSAVSGVLQTFPQTYIFVLKSVISVVADTPQFHNSVTLTKEERLRRKAESTDPIPIRLTNNYTFHWLFKKT